MTYQEILNSIENAGFRYEYERNTRNDTFCVTIYGVTKVTSDTIKGITISNDDVFEMSFEVGYVWKHTHFINGDCLEIHFYRSY